MTERQEILCPKCGSKTHRVSFEPNEITGRMVATFHCHKWGIDHEFKTDNEGNILDENGECKYCD